MSLDVTKAIYYLISEGNAGLNLYPDYAEPDVSELPDEEYGVISVIGASPSDTKDGPSTLDVVEIEITIYSKTDANLLNLAADIRTDIDRVAYGSYNGVTLNGVRFMNEDTDFDGITKRFEKMMRFSVRVKR